MTLSRVPSALGGPMKARDFRNKKHANDWSNPDTLNLGGKRGKNVSAFQQAKGIKTRGVKTTPRSMK